MLTVAYTGNNALTVTETSMPPPGRGEVQIAVAYVGLCGTDLHILHGDMDSRVDMPAVIGHEMSGTIAALGADVTAWSVGDPVTVMPLDWDGTCHACRAGHEHLCQNLDFIGIDSPGALQQRWNVNASTVFALPASLSLEHAALVEPVAVAVHDVRRAELEAGDKAVVIGGGPIGALIATVARELDADVAVVELDQARRAFAADLGFSVIDPAAEDQAAWTHQWTRGAGADVVFEVSGAAAAIREATALVKARGTLVVVAIHPQPRPFDLHRVFWRELRILGARVYRREDFATAIKLLDTGRVPADRLISAIEPITNSQAAFNMLQTGGAMKILIDVQAGV